VFDNKSVLQIVKTQDTRNYRQLGDSTIRTLFFVQDNEKDIQQIWVSENGSRITKLIDRIDISHGNRLITIPNARSDMLIVYSESTQHLNIYSIPNAKKCFFPHELEKFLLYDIPNFMYDSSQKSQFFLFGEALYYFKDGNL
jgi:hypothetical protein